MYSNSLSVCLVSVSPGCREPVHGCPIFATFLLTQGFSGACPFLLARFADAADSAPVTLPGLPLPPEAFLRLTVIEPTHSKHQVPGPSPLEYFEQRAKPGFPLSQTLVEAQNGFCMLLCWVSQVSYLAATCTCGSSEASWYATVYTTVLYPSPSRPLPPSLLGMYNLATEATLWWAFKERRILLVILSRDRMSLVMVWT